MYPLLRLKNYEQRTKPPTSISNPSLPRDYYETNPEYIISFITISETTFLKKGSGVEWGIFLLNITTVSLSYLKQF